MKTSTLLVLGAAAAGAAWWWWSHQKKTAPAARIPAGLVPVTIPSGIDWGFVDSLPVPGTSRVAPDGMRVLPAIYVG
jgi:hypothetical protein